jgi:KipI family sensor histidine kinase inhibitor
MRCVTRDVVDGALLVEFPSLSEQEANASAAALARKLISGQVPGVHDAVPGARTLLLIFDLDRFDRGAFEELLKSPKASGAWQPKTVRIPVVYGGGHGPDLEELARRVGISSDEFARLHREATYQVAFIGFAPGFPYLNGLPERLHSPRLSSPRPRVPAGSVGIGGPYTGVYPSSTPGGWRLIGNAPVRFFDATASPPALLSSGDRVLFEEIGESDLLRLRQQLADQRPSALKPTRPALRILSPGLCTSVQGAPRYGLAASGVPSGGAMDTVALRRGNCALKNPADAPALEITLQGPQVEVLLSARVCISGADVDAAVNGRPLSLEKVVDVRAGDRLRIGSVRKGARCYLCIHGGLVDPSFLGEPLRRLQRGDELCLAELGNTASGLDEVGDRARPASLSQTLRVVLGPQADRFSQEGKETFLSSEYRVSAQSDRRGVRLEGPNIESGAPADIPPEGTAAGAIQVPGNGLPIVLGPDRPVTGGYAKIATVISADLPLLAQARPGTLFRFKEVGIKEACAARSAWVAE